MPQQPDPSYSAQLGGAPTQLRIALWETNPFGRPVHEDCKAALAHAATLCESLGHHVELAAPELPVMEAFYTVQGGGLFSGQAAYFVRLAGCDVGCIWCDVKESWDASGHPVLAIADIVAEAARHLSTAFADPDERDKVQEAALHAAAATTAGLDETRNLSVSLGGGQARRTAHDIRRASGLSLDEARADIRAVADTDDERDSLSHKLIRLLERELAALGFAQENPYFFDTLKIRAGDRQAQVQAAARKAGLNSVSYTHLTLPTIYSV